MSQLNVVRFYKSIQKKIKWSLVDSLKTATNSWSSEGHKTTEGHLLSYNCFCLQGFYCRMPGRSGLQRFTVHIQNTYTQPSNSLLTLDKNEHLRIFFKGRSIFLYGSYWFWSTHPSSNLTNKSVHFSGLLIMDRHLPLLYVPILLHSWWFKCSDKVQIRLQVFSSKKLNLNCFAQKTLIFGHYRVFSPFNLNMPFLLE